MPKKKKTTTTSAGGVGTPSCRHLGGGVSAAQGSDPADISRVSGDERAAGCTAGPAVSRMASAKTGQEPETSPPVASQEEDVMMETVEEKGARRSISSLDSDPKRRDRLISGMMLSGIEIKAFWASRVIGRCIRDYVAGGPDLADGMAELAAVRDFCHLASTLSPATWVFGSRVTHNKRVQCSPSVVNIRVQTDERPQYRDASVQTDILPPDTGGETVGGHGRQNASAQTSPKRSKGDSRRGNRSGRPRKADPGRPPTAVRKEQGATPAPQERDGTVPSHGPTWAQVAARPPPPRQGPIMGNSSRRRRRRGPRRPPQGAAVWLQGEVSECEEILAKARRRVPLGELGITGLRVRSARAGGTLLELDGEGATEKATALADRIRREVCGSGGVRVTCPVRRSRIRLTGLMSGTTTEEIVSSVAGLAGCPPGEVRVGPTREGPGGRWEAWAELPAHAAARASGASGATIGWARVGITPTREDAPRCYRCLGRGHTQRWCPSGTDRAHCCVKCGVGGHFARDCGSPPHCPLCEERGWPRAAGHRPGSANCPPIPPRRTPRPLPPRKSNSEGGEARGGSTEVETAAPTPMDWSLEGQPGGRKRRGSGDLDPPEGLPQRPPRIGDKKPRS